MENNAAPSTLAAIPEEYFIKALAKLEKIDPLFSAKRKLFAFIMHPFAVNNAYAQTPTLLEYTGVKRAFLICPMDKRDNPDYSYAYNDSLNTLRVGATTYTSTIATWEALLNSNLCTTIDSISDTFTDYFSYITNSVARHTHMFGYAEALGVGGDGRLARFKNGDRITAY
jgi:hypothetical protein